MCLSTDVPRLDVDRLREHVADLWRSRRWKEEYIDSLVAHCVNEGRTFTDEEASKFDSAKDDIVKLDRHLSRLESHYKLDAQ
jgi:hypothetical protein